MFARHLILPAAAAAVLPAVPAAAQSYIDDPAVSRCEDAVANRIQRSIELERLAFATDPRVDRVSRWATEVRGDGFYVRPEGRVRIDFTYDCRFDERGYVPVVHITPPIVETRVRRWERRRPWRARVGDAPMPPIEQPAPRPADAEEPAMTGEAAAPAAPPAPERIEPAAEDAKASAAAEAAVEAVEAESVPATTDHELGGAVIAAIGDSKGSSEPDGEFDRGKQPYEPAEGITCYPDQRACYDSQGFDPRWTRDEFGVDEDEGAVEEAIQ